MTINSKTLISAIGAVLISAAPAVAKADLVYFLVGTHHVFRVGLDEYAHVGDRQKIEQTFADAVADAKATYDKHIADGADPAKESVDFNAYLAQLSDQRDQDLGSLYANADDIRARHPELQIEGEGPYQLMAINYHRFGDDYIFDDFRVFAPWPGYVFVGAPYGWEYGVLYNPFMFHSVYLGWHDRYYVPGRPAFYGFVGVSGAVNINITVGTGGHGYAVGGHPIGDFHRMSAARAMGGSHAPTGYGAKAVGGYGAVRSGGGFGPGRTPAGYGGAKAIGGYGAGTRPAGGYGATKTSTSPFGAARPAIGGYGRGTGGTSTGSKLPAAAPSTSKPSTTPAKPAKAPTGPPPPKKKD